MVQRSSLVGRQFGNYQLLRLLGAGGFAEVYLGKHIDLDTQAAIKVLHTQLSPTDIDNFRKEARTIAHLHHPHIIRVLDFNAAGSTALLVMDYAVGGTMRQRYPKGSIVSLSTVVSSIQQVADALQYAHNKKLIHRDIKPENILLGEQDNVLLSDFGIALVEQTSRNRNTQDVSGTASYMSPEQFRGKPEKASDQYALATVVYEWLSGSVPFSGGDFIQLGYQHTHEPVPPLRGKVPTVSPEVERVVMTALVKDPKQRFDSVLAFASALQQASEAGQEQTILSAHPPIYLWSGIHTTENREENVGNAQSRQIPSVCEPLHVLDSANWMSEPAVSSHVRRDFGPSTKKSSKESRRRVVAFLAAGGVAAAGAAVTLKLDRLMVLVNQFSTTYAQANKTKSVTQVNTQPTQPPQTQPTQPPAYTGTVIGNTKQNANSAVEFVNPADTTASILVRLANSQFVAYERACTHVGVLVNYDPATKKLVCPAHGAVFDPANGGAVVQGPAKLPLPKVGIQVQADGTVTTV